MSYSSLTSLLGVSQQDHRGATRRVERRCPQALSTTIGLAFGFVTWTPANQTLPTQQKHSGDSTLISSLHVAAKNDVCWSRSLKSRAHSVAPGDSCRTSVCVNWR